MKKEFLDYLDDIVDAMNKVEDFTKDMKYEEFTEDDKTTFAVIRALEIIGEAVKKMPPSIKKQHPQIPWKDMAGMRDKLIHEYFGVKTKVVWETIKQDIPPLKPLFQRILAEEK